MVDCCRRGLAVAVLLCAVLPSPALALGTNAIESDWGTFRERWSPALELKLKGSKYNENSELTPKDFHLSGSLTGRFNRQFGDNLMLQIDPRANLDTLSSHGGQLIVEDELDRPGFTFNELFFSWYGDGLEVQAGKKIYSWKVADAYSPLDSVNPVDVIVAADPEKIGVPSLSLLSLTEPVNVQVIFLPLFVPDRQPDRRHRWSSDDPERRAAFVQRFGVEPVLVDAGRDLTDNRFDKPSIASRLSSSTLVTGWDLSAVVRYGYSSRGVLRNDINPVSLPLVRQTTEYPEYALYGAGFSTCYGDLEWHGEAALHDTRDNDKDEDYLSTIFGFTYTNYAWLDAWLDHILLAAEYAGETVVRDRFETSRYSDKGVGRGLTDNIIGSIEFQIDADRSLKSTVTYNFQDRDAMLDLSAESRLSGHMKIKCGYQQLSGDETSFFGQWDANDRFYLDITINF